MTLLRASQAFHLTRMDIPFLLGTSVTPNRDRAKVVGVTLIGAVIRTITLVRRQ